MSLNGPKLALCPWSAALLALFLTSFFSLTAIPLHAQEKGAPAGKGSIVAVRDSSVAFQDSLAQEWRKAMASLTTPELEQRKANRLLSQRQGYAEILNRTLASDGLGAMLAYCRSALRLEFSLPRNTLVVYIPVTQPVRRDTLPGPLYQFRSGPIGIPLREDRSFPEDPWGKR
jgi:hypothetical protein